MKTTTQLRTHYIEVALALFEQPTSITEEVIEQMMFTYANETKGTFKALFHDLDEVQGYEDHDQIIELHSELIEYLNNQAFTSVEIGLKQLSQWIDIKNEDYQMEQIELNQERGLDL